MMRHLEICSRVKPSNSDTLTSVLRGPPPGYPEQERFPRVDSKPGCESGNASAALAFGAGPLWRSPPMGIARAASGHGWAKWPKRCGRQKAPPVPVRTVCRCTEPLRSSSVKTRRAYPRARSCGTPLVSSLQQPRWRRRRRRWIPSAKRGQVSQTAGRLPRRNLCVPRATFRFFRS